MSFFVEDSFWIFLIMTVIFGGGAAFLAGRAQASGWRPMWQALAFMVLLGAALRFLHFALFQAELLSLHYFLTDTLVLMVGCALGYRMTLASQMVRQYPWLYERAGPLGWRNKA
ncbi:MAG: hypothetical protein FJX63_08615 [Alphaproteobacteria bacterium]|nr:hypothetical protein [Alphaproteobacteria bacterium]